MTLFPPNLTYFLTHFERKSFFVLPRAYWWPSEPIELNLLSSQKCTLDKVVIRSRNMLFSQYKSSNFTCFTDKRLDGWGAGFQFSLTQTSRHYMTRHISTQISADLSRYFNCCVVSKRFLINKLWIVRSSRALPAFFIEWNELVSLCSFNIIDMLLLERPHLSNSR